jgi:hypothetical protein
VHCQHCRQGFLTSQGLASHRFHKHGVTKPRAKTQRTPRRIVYDSPPPSSPRSGQHIARSPPDLLSEPGEESLDGTPGRTQLALELLKFVFIFFRTPFSCFWGRSISDTRRPSRGRESWRPDCLVLELHLSSPFSLLRAGIASTVFVAACSVLAMCIPNLNLQGDKVLLVAHVDSEWSLVENLRTNQRGVVQSHCFFPFVPQPLLLGECPFPG